MLLDQSLSFIAIASWIIAGIVLLIYFWHTVQRAGIPAAIRGLLRWRIFILLLVLVCISLLSAALVFIQPQQIGVVVSIVSADGYRDQPLRSGLHWIVPLAEEVHTYPIYWQTYTMSGKMFEGQMRGDDSISARTSDGQEVFIDCSVIFRIDTLQAVRIYIDWQNRYVEDFVRPVLRGIIRTQVSQYKVDEVNSFKRLDLERDLGKEVGTVFSDKGFILDRFILRNITFSKEYSASVEQKQVAYQEMTRTVYQAQQVKNLAEGEANKIRIEAGAQAEAIKVKANAQAQALQVISDVLMKNENLLTYQYIDKLAPGIKVMLVPNNSPFLLPLPDLGLTEPSTLTGQPAIGTPRPVLPTLPSYQEMVTPSPEIEATATPSP
jgi:regulator of protease activity HflC (stomatin/prohibitin superfamily)